MKTTIPSPSLTSSLKQDPFQRLSLAVKKLDQLISRTHQLGTSTNEFLRDDTTGPDHSPSETELTQPAPSHAATTLSKPGHLPEQDMKSVMNGEKVG